MPKIYTFRKKRYSFENGRFTFIDNFTEYEIDHLISSIVYHASYRISCKIEDASTSLLENEINKKPNFIPKGIISEKK